MRQYESKTRLQNLVLNAWPTWMDCTGKRDDREEKGFGEGGAPCCWTWKSGQELGVQSCEFRGCPLNDAMGKKVNSEFLPQG